MRNDSEVPAAWRWKSGVAQESVQYRVEEPGDTGILTWTEEIAPEDDERGNGSYREGTQTRAAFLESGPPGRPPVAIVETLLAYFQASPPPWLGPYRLLAAASEQDLTAVQEILAQDVPADTLLYGVTPLYEAIRRRNLPLAETLFSAGVALDRRFPGSDETLLMALASSAPDARWEPLAARMVAQMVEQGIDREGRNTWGETALMYAAGAGNRLPGLPSILLAAGAGINARSRHGYTALMKAVMYRHAPAVVVETLLAAGADVNARDNEGWSALMWAISNELVACVDTLLEAGADVNIVSVPTPSGREAKSVLQLAIDYAQPEILARIRAACHRPVS